jgi:membrane protease YdiL (CAAX protease family)
MELRVDSEGRVAREERPRGSAQVRAETVLLLLCTSTAQFLWKEYAILFALIPTAYLVGERFLRKRTWRELGFRGGTILRDARSSWFLILCVGVIVQALVVMGARAWQPAFLGHVAARLPVGSLGLAGFLPLVLIGTFWEEVNFRALYQERLSWFLPLPVAIGLVSLLFGAGHWNGGDPALAIVDVLLVVVDSVLYGVIFARSRNVFVAWVAHFLADITGLTFMMLF